MSQKGRKTGFIAIEAIIMIIIVIVIIYYIKDNKTVNFFWNSFTDNMQRMSKGQANDWQLAAPVFNNLGF